MILSDWLLLTWWCTAVALIPLPVGTCANAAAHVLATAREFLGADGPLSLTPTCVVAPSRAGALAAWSAVRAQALPTEWGCRGAALTDTETGS